MSKTSFPSAGAPRGSRVAPRILAGLASALLLASLALPLWRMRLEAPQYRDEEALQVAVHPNKMRGDLRELSVLNQYIGVHVPATLPQFRWLPIVLVAASVAGGAAAWCGMPVRRRALIAVSLLLGISVAAAAVQANVQMHDIGHKRDQKTVLAGMKDFTPPFLGTNKIAQFTVTSTLGAGAWLIGAALALQLGAACWPCKARKRIPAVVKISPVLDPAASTIS